MSSNKAQTNEISELELGKTKSKILEMTYVMKYGWLKEYNLLKQWVLKYGDSALKKWMIARTEGILFFIPFLEVF